MWIMSINGIWKSSFMTQKNALCLIWLGMRGVRNDSAHTHTHTHSEITYKFPGHINRTVSCESCQSESQTKSRRVVCMCVFTKVDLSLHEFECQVCEGFTDILTCTGALDRRNWRSLVFVCACAPWIRSRRAWAKELGFLLLESLNTQRLRIEFHQSPVYTDTNEQAWNWPLRLPSKPIACWSKAWGPAWSLTAIELHRNKTLAIWMIIWQPDTLVKINKKVEESALKPSVTW